MMADLSMESVDIFDDFDDAQVMESAYCKQVSEEQFQEDTRSETDKALGELCLYLDQNPEVYARVLRKRKQEEMEGGGVISYVKSKMMVLLHREKYPQCLVSTGECVQKTNALKAGMCKTFQLSQELKGNVTRQSARLAAKRQAQLQDSDTEDNQARDSGDGNAQRKTNKRKPDIHNKSTSSDKPREASPRSKPNDSTDLSGDSSKDTSSAFTVGTVPVEKVVKNKIIKNKPTSTENFQDKNSKPENEKGKFSSDTEVTQGQRAELEISSSINIPPPPPLPPILIRSSFLGSSMKDSSAKTLTKVTDNNLVNHSPRPSPLAKSKASFVERRRSSPRVRAEKVYFEKVPSRASSVQNLSKLSRSDSLSSVNSPFLTPPVPSRLRAHKRSQSNSSVVSSSSCESFSSVHSEIMSSNPITRLKATQVIRSPGGTPLRSKLGTEPSEPFHKALFTAIQSRFRNVSTPSPHSRSASVNASNSSVLNSTFSP